MEAMNMEKFPDMLIGMQLVNWNKENQTLTVRDGERLFDLQFDDSDEGDCCGFNNFFAELLVSDHDLSLNPVITHVEVEECERSFFGYRGGEQDHVKVTFFGGANKLFYVDSESSSGSGWGYGACVTVKCSAIGLDECITSW
jgi:hypothetical protein